MAATAARMSTIKAGIPKPMIRKIMLIRLILAWNSAASLRWGKGCPSGTGISRNLQSGSPAFAHLINQELAGGHRLAHGLVVAVEGLDRERLVLETTVKGTLPDDAVEHGSEAIHPRIQPS